LIGAIGVRGRLPDTRFAELEHGEIRVRPTAEIFGGKRVALVGAPGAFSPICTRIHLPEFIAQAPAMMASGFDLVACVTPNDPWTLAAWAAAIDPMSYLRFLSDGNLEFGRAAGLAAKYDQLFLGHSLLRFSMIVTNCVVEKIGIETSVLSVTCSSVDHLLRGS